MTQRQRPPTMQDVAERAGVSRALVSLVMRDAPNVSVARRAAVRKAAAELDYRPNAAARSLAERRSNTIGVVVNDLHNTFFADVIDGIHEVAMGNGYRLLLNTAWRTDDDELKAIEAFLEYRVDAIVVLGPRAAGEKLELAGSSVPLVAVGSITPGVDVVVNDDERGSELVVEYLVDLGHRRIVHIDGGGGGGASRRSVGFVNAMERHGLDPFVVPGDFTESSGAAAMSKLLKAGEPPTAVFAANDLAAVGALDELTKAGFDVPGDVSVVGYDNTAIAALSHIGLTTINQPRREMGRQTMELALDRLDQGRKAAVTRVVTPELVVRRTTAAI